eukprot:6196905-Pleurochrysis_carterae.AAC.3
MKGGMHVDLLCMKAGTCTTARARACDECMHASARERVRALVCVRTAEFVEEWVEACVRRPLH